MTEIKKLCRKALARRRREVREARRFLSGYGVKTKEELIAAVERYELYLRRSAELDAVQQRLDASIASYRTDSESYAEEDVAALLTDAEIRAELPAAIENLVKRIEAFDSELKGKLELSGRLGQQADVIASKKDSIRQRFQAVAADLRLARMAELWQSRAVAGQMMEDIRRAYEKERQPETLREASRYLKRLTNGMYVNIWTPLGEDALFVDASNGETLDVGALSRGTRELLFIAIRLALVVSFEKHGVQMPLIWDDVLVNFDYKRAATAAKLLVDFAKAGRQIFLFTCHEHICQLFLRLGTPVCVLPTQIDPAKRKFRVLTPVKKSKRDLTVDVDQKDDGLSFVAEPGEVGPETLVVESREPETEVASEERFTYNERFKYKLSDDPDGATDATVKTDVESETSRASVASDSIGSSDLNSVDGSSVDFKVESDFPDASADLRSEVADPASFGREAFAYDSVNENEPNELVAKVDDASETTVERVLPVMETGSSFSSANLKGGNEFKVVDDTLTPDDEDAPESAFDGEDDVDYVEIDPDAEFDVDEDGGWTSLVSRIGEDSDENSEKSFGEFMINDTESYSVDAEEDEEEYDEEGEGSEEENEEGEEDEEESQEEE